MTEDKFILDACCGPKMMWYNKNHPNTLYIDIRKEPKGFIKGAENTEIEPDVQADFRKLPKEIKKMRFKLIVWDIPHFKARKLTGILTKKFGGLNPETWPSDVERGFKELWSVLEDYGILLLKFNNYHIKFKNLLEHIPEEPLFFNFMSGRKGPSETKWFCFMKIPSKKLEVSE